MKLSLVLQAFCLLTTVFLCGGQEDSSAPETAATETVTTETAAAETVTTETVPLTATTDVSNMTTDDASNTTIIPTIITDSTESVPTTEIVKESNSGLSPGAIAGITIGSIAGVGAVGGGIFGILKYTGKI